MGETIGRKFQKNIKKNTQYFREGLDTIIYIQYILAWYRVVYTIYIVIYIIYIEYHLANSQVTTQLNHMSKNIMSTPLTNHQYINHYHKTGQSQYLFNEKYHSLKLDNHTSYIKCHYNTTYQTMSNHSIITLYSKRYLP